VSTRFASLALAAAGLLAGCAGNPASDSPSVVFSSRSGEAKIGAENHQEFVDKGMLYDDPKLQEYVSRIGQRLVKHSDEPDMTFTFTVIDSPAVNASAYPGGYIYIYRGLLAYLENEAELAGVLGHEIAHVTARHHGRGKAHHVSNQVLSTTAGILTGSGNVYGATRAYGHEIVSGYGREMELEADGLGAEYMHSSGYDPEALLDVIGVLKDHQRYQRLKARDGGQQVAVYHGLYATHPRNDQRLQTVVRKAAELEGYADSPALQQALADYLDPDGDGVIAIMRWDTLEERGTIGFYAERRQPGGAWTRINDSLLPGLITAPMGGEYQLVDPGARRGIVYEYRLVEIEARGSTRTYGPYTLQLQ